MPESAITKTFENMRHGRLQEPVQDNSILIQATLFSDYGITMSELAETMQTSKQTLHRHLKVLEGMGGSREEDQQRVVPHGQPGTALKAIGCSALVLLLRERAGKRAGAP